MPNLKLYLVLKIVLLSFILSAQATYVVTGNYDDPNIPHTAFDCSPGNTNCPLRAAIQKANIDGKASNIIFNLPAPSTISLLEELPALTEPQTIINGLDDTYQNYNLGQLIINGGSLNQGNGISINAQDCAIYGLYIRNFIATNNDFGIYVAKTAQNSIIAHNVINNNGGGIYIAANDVLIEDNHIGLVFGNEIGEGNATYGIEIDGTGGVIKCLIGLDGANYIGDNGGSGIYAHGDIILLMKNNIIGTTNKQVMDFGNGKTFGVGNGVWVDASAGSSGEITSNYIVYNHTNGIRFGANTSNFIVENNDLLYHSTYGVVMEDQEEGTVNNSGKLISQNSFYCNSLGGIFLQNEANNSKKEPVIQYLDFGYILGKAAPDDVVELYYADQECETCQGAIYFQTVQADNEGIWSLNWNFAASDKITALALDKDDNTSEFSACRQPSNINDNCPSAIDILLSEDPCIGETATGSNYFANHSGVAPPNDCNNEDPGYNGADIWFKTTIPDTEKLLIRQRSGTNINVVMAIYDGSCGNLITPPVTCATFYDEPKYLLIEADKLGLAPKQEIYIRVWDFNNMKQGDVVLSAHILSESSEEWIFCDEAGGAFNPRQFIVSFEPDADGEIKDLEQFLDGMGAKQVSKCDCSPKKFQLWEEANNLTMEACRKAARTRAKVDTVGYNYFIDEQFTQKEGDPNTSLNGYDPSTTNSAVRVSVVDTGVKHDHGDINAAIYDEGGVVEGCVTEPQYFGYDFVNDIGEPKDTDSHGTAVNSIIAFNFPDDIQLELTNSKFFDTPRGTLFEAVCGIHYGIEKGAAVMNLSWGLERDSIPYLLHDALKRTRDHDLVVVTSAGNLGKNNDLTPKWPANSDLENLISVAAFSVFSPDSVLASYSHFGLETVDIAAHGYALAATFTTDGEDNLDVFSGTSIATPFVTQTAAIMRARAGLSKQPYLSAPQIKACILNTANPINGLRDRMLTGGALDQNKAILCATNSTLPIVEIFLKATLLNNHSVQLNWTNPSFITRDILHIERSTDGINWEVLTTIYDATTQQYIDKELHAPAYFYKIIITDEGQKKYPSNVKHVKVLNFDTTIEIYPNPLRGNTFFINVKDTKEALHLYLYNTAGQLIWSKSDIFDQSIQEITLPPHWSGIFWLHGSTASQSWQQKLIILDD